MNMCSFAVNISFHFSRVNKYPGIILLGHKLSICLTSWETITNYFSEWQNHLVFPGAMNESSSCSSSGTSVFSL